jgi:hypothetical protein
MNKFLVTILAVVLASCQPKSPIDGNSGHNALFSFLSNNPACTAEGSLVTMGLDKNDNGVLDVNEVQYSMDVCNGIKGDIGGIGPVGNTGPAGATAPISAFTPVDVITPCGASSAHYKEVLLGLANGDILSEFTGNGGIANVFIPDGSYYDTDTSSCNFTVSTSANGDRSILWNGSSHSGGVPYTHGSAHYDVVTMTWTVSY